MPPRSVLLNLSITAKSIEKERVVESVREVEAGRDRDVMREAEGKRERVDSATSVLPSPSFSDILNTTLATTTTTSSDEMTIVPQACGTCESIARSDGTKLRYCTGCRRILYCSVNCQKQDWSRHKPDCQRARGIIPTNSATTSPPAQSPSSFPPSEVASPIDMPSPAAMVIEPSTVSTSKDVDMDVDSD